MRPPKVTNDDDKDHPHETTSATEAEDELATYDVDDGYYDNGGDDDDNNDDNHMVTAVAIDENELAADFKKQIIEDAVEASEVEPETFWSKYGAWCGCCTVLVIAAIVSLTTCSP